MEAELILRSQIPFETIPAAGVHGVGWRSLPGNLWRLMQGTLAARRILRRFQPQVLLFTGGYVAVPMALAGRSLPSLLYVPDVEPGLALKFLARFSDRIAVTAQETSAYLAKNSRPVVTGYPTRPELHAWTRSTGKEKLGLNNDKPVLLVVGGSKGARSINRALLANLPTLLDHCQVVHLTGTLDWAEIQQAQQTLTDAQSTNYHPFPYLHEEIGAALASADLIVSRSGASVLGEYPLFGLPALLVPYPYAWRYQRVNADYLVRHGAALMLENHQLEAQLLPTVLELFADPTRLEKMGAAMKQLASPQAADNLAQLILELGASPLKTGGLPWSS